MSKALEIHDPTPCPPLGLRPFAAAHLAERADGPEPARQHAELPKIDRIPETLRERLSLARERLKHAAFHGLRIRVYEVALDLDMSEFHFARQFRSAFGCSPHVYYDEVRAARARDLLRDGVAPGQAARRIGLRRPAELRALLEKRCALPSAADVDGFEQMAAE
jgi:AraC-like DNA-binding protein